MDEGGERLFLFMGRDIGRHKQHLPQRVAAGGRPGQGQVPAMDGVEAAAENTDIHLGIAWSVAGCKSVVKLKRPEPAPKEAAEKVSSTRQSYLGG